MWRIFFLWLTSCPIAFGQLFNGTGLGIEQGANIKTGSSIVSISGFITTFLGGILVYVGLAAVTIIVIAGIFLIISGGNEDMKNQAKRMIQYTILGLIVIALSSAIVTFFTQLL